MSFPPAFRIAKNLPILAVLAIAMLSGISATPAQEQTAVLDDKLAKTSELFVHRVLPLFKEKCFACHGAETDDIRGELNMMTRAGLLAGGESGDPSLVIGAPKSSLLVEAIRWEGLEMPPKENDRLTEAQIKDVEDWIAGGAPWPNDESIKRIRAESADKWNTPGGVKVAINGGLTDDWNNRTYAREDLWAYRPVLEPNQELREADNPIDYLINRQLKLRDIQPTPSADKRTLIRRLCFDLTGLPPTPDQVKRFLDDQSPDAYERLVDRLLASPRYGEQWARHWLDVVRYADSSGFSNDFTRANAWRYRDYVIRSFNQDKPYDRFVQEQIAGDELFPDEPESSIAVGYLRMGPWEHTAMSVEAVTRQHFLDDITNSVGVTFMAHELRCASCHDHKFDPIPTRDYYRVQAVFASTQFADKRVPFQTWENTDGIEQQRDRIKRLQKQTGVRSLSTIPKSEWPVTQWDQDSETKGHKKVNNKRTQILQRELKRFEPIAFSVYSGPTRKFMSPKVYAYPPKPANRKGLVDVVHILTGGSIETPSVAVTAGVLSVVDSGKSTQIPASAEGRRAELARWLTDPDHPLTARVIANRVWQYHFGKALAGNPNNFGVTGKKPTHPKLLDFLALYLVEQKWSIKQLHRLIVTSETYQRSSGPKPDGVAEQDPDNLLYSHWSPRRLAAEELRDTMLFASGELNLEMGGVPARPEINLEVAMQPRHIMGSVAPAYQPSPLPAQRNRRTIYAERIRTLRDPMLEVFNQPGLDTSCERRDASTITPQAFTQLNSQNTQDRSIAWANRLMQQHASIDQRIEAAFTEAFGRDCTADELTACRQHYTEMLGRHAETQPARVEPPHYVIREMVEEMTGLAFYWVEDLDIYANSYQPDLKPWDVNAETRALADVCLALLNANEFIYVY